MGFFSSNFRIELRKLKTKKIGQVLLVLLSVVLLIWHSSFMDDWIVDDSAISFSYSQNLVNNGCFSLTPLGERTEGFSNPLLVFLISFLMKVQLFSPFWTSRILGICFSTASFILVARIAENFLFRLRGFGWGLGLFLGTSSSFVIWTFAGLENPLYVFLILFLVERFVSYFKRQHNQTRLFFWKGIGLLLFAIAITRPEGALYGVVTVALVFQFVVLWPSNQLKGQWRPLIDLCFAFFIPLLLFFFWRWSYFHDFLANPYYAKMLKFYQGESSNQQWVKGWIYLKEGISIQYFHFIGIFALFGLLRVRDPRVFVLFAFGFAASFFPVYSGGDWMMEFRFLTPLFPLILVGGILGLETAINYIPNWPRFGKYIVLLFLAGFLMVSGMIGFRRTIVQMEHPTIGVANAERTARSFRTWGDGVGLETVNLLIPDVGGTALWGSQNRLEIIDLGGLGDRLIARNGVGPQLWKYIFENHKPDFMTFHDGWAIQLQAQNFPGFYDLYQPIWETRHKWFPKNMPNIKAGAYVRRDLISVKTEQISQIIEGPQVDGFFLKGVSGEIRKKGKNVLTVYMECVKEGPIPSIGLVKSFHKNLNPEVSRKLVGGGCYKNEFMRIGDIVPTSFILSDSALSQGIVLRLIGSEKPLSPIHIPQEFITWKKNNQLDELVNRGYDHISKDNLDSCLEVVQKIDQAGVGVKSKEFRKLRENLSQLFFSRADSVEMVSNSIVDKGLAWDLYWKACAAWRGNSKALLKCSDLYRLRLLADGSSSARSILEEAMTDSSDPILSYGEIFQRVTTPVFPLDKLWFRDQFSLSNISIFPEIETDLGYLTGWGSPEHWGRWALASRSNLLVDIPFSDTGESNKLFLRMASWQTDGPVQRVVVLFEGIEIGEIFLEDKPWEMQSYELPLPPWCGKAVITFFVDELISDHSGNDTPRAFPLESWEITQD